MQRELIAPYSIEELRRAASEGKACYSCEKFEDTYGRLMVGIGAPLEGRSLDRVIRAGRQEVFASKVAMCDGVGLRLALKRMILSKQEVPKPAQNGTFIARLRKIVGVCPEAEKLVVHLNPSPDALNHGSRVATYAGRVAQMFNHIRDCGFGSAVYPYPKRSSREVSLAGILHDIGKWKGRPEIGHESRGSEILSRAEGNSICLHQAREIIERHHETPEKLCSGGWKTHKIIPVAVAEAILESQNSLAALCGMIPDRVDANLSILLAALSNLESVIPARSVVRLNSKKGPAQLAVSLRLGFSDPGPVLLRFATWSDDGHLLTLFRRESPIQMVAPFLIARGHPVWGNLEREVVSILAKDTYDSTFARYDHLVPRFHAALARQLNQSTRTNDNPDQDTSPVSL